MSATDTGIARAPSAVGRRPLGWWGMVLLITTEATLFSLLLFANFYLRANNHPWPPAGVEKPKLLLSGIRSFILWGSSIPAALAERALRRDDLRRFRAMLVAALVMAAVFLAGHIQEYVELSAKLTPTDSAYGSSFYTITGLHAIHLLVGMVVLAYLVVQSLRGRYDPGRPRTGATCGIMYWHFVDVVWLAVYPSLYLSVTW